MRRLPGERSAARTKFACVDGPEFDGHQVDYDELMQRLQAYCEEEKACHEDYLHRFVA